MTAGRARKGEQIRQKEHGHALLDPMVLGCTSVWGDRALLVPRGCLAVPPGRWSGCSAQRTPLLHRVVSGTGARYESCGVLWGAVGCCRVLWGAAVGVLLPSRLSETCWSPRAGFLQRNRSRDLCSRRFKAAQHSVS